MSRILIVTPAPPGSRKGNRITASRWAGMLRSLGHSVTIRESFRNERCDVLIALHARKSAADIKRFRASHPEGALVVALTGTDLYRDIHRSRAAQNSLQLADRLVLLQPHGQEELLSELHAKVRVVMQSAEPPAKRPQSLQRVFEVCVSGHLRPVKDPFRAARALRQLPPSSRIQITQIGAALTESMQSQADREVQINPRYRWLGEVTPGRAKQILARSRLLVLSSKMEGGANVVSEALAAGVPVLSSRISGSIGLLGEDYSGYFEVGDTAGLADLMLKCEQDESFLTLLREQCRKKASLVNPECERESLRNLIDELS